MCFFLCTNYLNIVHLIIHIAFHLHNFIVYFLSTLQIFFFQFFVNVYVDFHIADRILFWQKTYSFFIFSLKENNILVENGGVKSK